MKKNEKTNSYELFYSELPSRSFTTDYPKDIEIQHAYEEPRDNHGLSAKQVSLIAHDSLEEASQRRQGQRSFHGLNATENNQS
jgi:hypothetical protein